MKQAYKIGELSKLYGISVDSLRYYEKIGLLQPYRSESGYRYYSHRDIWKLNTIRDLRDLGFSMEQIRQYLSDHSVETTLALLSREQQAIDEKIAELQKLHRNVEKRRRAITDACQLPVDQIRLAHFPCRRCYTIGEGYTHTSEMDVLMRRLQNMDREHLYLIGSNQLGTVISGREAQSSGKVRYESVFVLDDRGGDILPEGDYLTVTYRGDYAKSEYWIGRLFSWAKEREISLQGDFLEILLVDIHTSREIGEQITQLQVRAIKNKI